LTEEARKEEELWAHLAIHDRLFIGKIRRNWSGRLSKDHDARNCKNFSTINTALIKDWPIGKLENQLEDLPAADKSKILGPICTLHADWEVQRLFCWQILFSIAHVEPRSAHRFISSQRGGFIHSPRPAAS
jgi:hypothetical protein